MPAPKYIYMRKNVRGRTRRFPIGNDDSQRCQNQTPKTNKYEREERSSSSPIASSRPIGKAEAADCISPIKGRELRGDDDDDNNLEQKTVFVED